MGHYDATNSDSALGPTHEAEEKKGPDHQIDSSWLSRQAQVLWKTGSDTVQLSTDFLTEHPVLSTTISFAAGGVALPWAKTRFAGLFPSTTARVLGWTESLSSYNPDLITLVDRVDLASTVTKPHLQFRLAALEKDPSVLEALASNQKLLPKTQQSLVHAGNGRILETLASNPSITNDSAVALMKHASRTAKVLENLAGNQNISYSAAEALVKHPNLSATALENLAENRRLTDGGKLDLVKTGRVKVLENLSLNMDISPKVAEALAQHPNTDFVSKANLLGAVNFPPETQLNLIDTSHEQLQMNLAGNPNLTREAQIELIKTGKHSVLNMLVENRNLTPATMKVLAEHPNLSGPSVHGLIERPDITAESLRILVKRPGTAKLLEKHPYLSDIIEAKLSGKAAVLTDVASASTLGQEASLAAKSLRAIGTYGGLAPLVGLPAYRAYEEWNKGGSSLEVATSAGKGFIDGIVPGATDGYSDVIGPGDRTYLDRVLNGMDHATGTAAAIGGAAVGVEALGIVTAPTAIPTAFATGVAVLGNVSVNVLKAGVKVTGYAGRDQDGGYIYDGVAWTGRQGGYAIDWAGRKLSSTVAWVGL